MQNEQVINLLTKEYSIILATTPQHFQSVKKIRKEVFSSKYDMSPNQLESIGFIYNQEDKQSFIYLLKHNQTNKYVGTVRIFFINNKTDVQQLPMQKNGRVRDIDLLIKTLPLIEISRAALIQNLPHHKKYSRLQLSALLTFRLRIATRINFLLYPCKMIFSIMEPSLQRILKKQKVNFEPIGDFVDSCGIKKIPFAIQREKLLQDTEETMGTITRHYLKELCQNPDSFWEFIDNNPYLERSDIQLDRICQLFKEYGDDVDLSLLLGEDTVF